MSPVHVRIAAHRGGADEAPENSPTAFRHAIALVASGLDEIEFDVQMTADHHIVVHHDALLDRTTTGRGLLSEHTLADLQDVEIKQTRGERLLTLDAACAMLAGSSLGLRCELKGRHDGRPYDGLAAAALETLETHGVLERTVVTAFALETLDALAELPRAAALAGVIWLVTPGVLAHVGLDRVIGLAQGASVSALGLHHTTLDPAVRTRIVDAQLGCGAWAAHDADAITRVLALGVSVFTCDRPTLALRLRAQSVAS